MQQPDYYNTIETTGTAEFKDRGSKFLALAFPVKTAAACKNILSTVKKDHPKANHHCFAYRLGTTQNDFRVNDDGEPSGTAGKPILGQIDSKNVTDILIVVVRYFGGTLLGVSGLINAYKSAASMVLQVTPPVRKPVMEQYHLQFDYTQMNEVMMIVKQTGCEILKQELQLFCMMNISVPKNKEEDVVWKLKHIRNLEYKKM
jgi:uncharacterized YigZ family protein